jgi:hypothetical protein
MNSLREIAICLATTFAAGILFVNVYTSIVDAPNWGRDIPASIEATRNYFVVANPGTFFRLAAPINQVVTLIALVACWTLDTRVRYYLLAALVIAVATDAMTFTYFYPRNAIMFENPIDGNTEAIRTAWKGWTLMNWPRSIIVAIALFLDFAALLRFAGRTGRGALTQPHAKHVRP